MTAYRNYVQDFPSRSRDLLNEFSLSARALNKEVTLLLAVATPCLIVPYERLRNGLPAVGERKFTVRTL
jgi:hypothetical protein